MNQNQYDFLKSSFIRITYSNAMMEWTNMVAVRLHSMATDRFLYRRAI